VSDEVKLEMQRWSREVKERNLTLLISMKQILNEWRKFLLEKKSSDKDNPLEGGWGTTINGHDVSGKVKDLVDFSKEYKVQNLEIKDLPKSLWNDRESVEVFINGKLKKYKDLSPEQKKEQDDLINQKIDNSDLKYPIIVAKDKEEKIKSILDGNHRLAKAQKLGKSKIRAIIIPEQDIIKHFS